MKKPATATILFCCSMLFAIWYALAASMWAYYANLFIALPVGLISLALWSIGRKMDEGRTRYKLIPRILIGGTVVSFVVLGVLLVTN